MIYEMIVLGATFTAAGIAENYGENCIILERSTRAGYEFLDALSFGTHYHISPVSSKAKQLLKVFESKKAFCGDRVCLYDCMSSFYRLLENKQVLLGAEIIDIKKEDELFCCTFHGVQGYRKIYGKKVVDTRVHPQQIVGKTYNFSIDGTAEFTGVEGAITEKWGTERNWVLRCPVANDCTYYRAREAAYEIIKKLPQAFKMLVMAGEFDYDLNGNAISDDGILYMPSKFYKNPILAYDAGVLYKAGGDI